MKGSPEPHQKRRDTRLGKKCRTRDSGSEEQRQPRSLQLQARVSSRSRPQADHRPGQSTTGLVSSEASAAAEDRVLLLMSSLWIINADP